MKWKVPAALRSLPRSLRPTVPAPAEWRAAAHRMGQHVQYYRGLYRDKRTPRRAKVLLALALAYFFSPFDFIPDFIPVLGQVDDLLVVPFLFGLANRSIPEEVKSHHHVKYLEEASGATVRRDASGA